MNQPVSTTEVSTSKTTEEIINEAKRVEESCLYSAKGHFVCAHFWSGFHLYIGIPSVVLAGVAGTTAFTDLPVIAGVTAVIVTILTSISTFLNPKERSSSHFTAANSYDSLQSKTRRFWSIECKSEQENVLTHKLGSLSEERDRINRESLQIPRWAYRKARKYIEDGEAEHEVDRLPVKDPAQ